jgi:hypothetical protein
VKGGWMNTASSSPGVGSMEGNVATIPPRELLERGFAALWVKDSL